MYVSIPSQDLTHGQFLSRIRLVSIQRFLTARLDALPKLKSSTCSSVYPYQGEEQKELGFSQGHWHEINRKLSLFIQPLRFAGISQRTLDPKNLFEVPRKLHNTIHFGGRPDFSATEDGWVKNEKTWLKKPVYHVYVVLVIVDHVRSSISTVYNITYVNLNLRLAWKRQII